ncbi:N-acetyl-gamma-glutamyl-phosphate reductase [Pendulispora albinea]|uniref:N-acetyl-gamma-glutamyl-phosphate reductase n=1 Tax=Pendulispora albinea TaxID=2741071 RepID=A0ABZ2LU75_9BACT
MHTSPVAILGGSGYAGIELTYLLAHHPRARIEVISSDRWVGDSLATHLGIEGKPGELVYASFEEAAERAKSCAVALLATPNEVSAQVAPKLLAAGCKVIDLSGAFRLTDDSSALAYYGKEVVGAKGDVRVGTYGLPEFFRDEVVDAKLIANPGCYPTAATLALAPLLEAGLIDRTDVIVNAVSGVTGAGRKSTEAYGFVAVDQDVRAYRVLAHQHTPEIAQVLSRRAGAEVQLTFTPHLVPIARGILSTAYGRLSVKASSADLTTALANAYAEEPFVSVVRSPNDVSLKQVVGTNRCVIGAASDASGRVVVVSAIDNLLKGAAGQAVQNLNLILGCDEVAGLTQLRRFHT